MTIYSDLSGAGEDLLFGVFGGTAVTVVQGTITLVVTDAWKGQVYRMPDPGRAGHDVEQVEWRFHASVLTGGGIVLGPGLTVTEGAKVWKADATGSVDVGQGEIVIISTWRRVASGVA